MVTPVFDPHRLDKKNVCHIKKQLEKVTDSSHKFINCDPPGT